MKGKRVFLAVFLGALIMSTAACNSEAKLTEGTDGKDFLLREVVLSEYKIVPARIKVQANAPIRFIVRNEGNFTHEFRVMVDPPRVLEVAPKSKDRMDMVFDKAGEYEFVCTLNGHERLGMKGEISVEAIE